MFFLVSVALAKEVLAPPPEAVSTTAEGLSFSRPGDEGEGGDPTEPSSGVDQARYEAWVRVVEARKDRRADLAEADTILKSFAPLVADCAAKGGVAVGAQATATVAFGANGSVRVTAKGGGDAGLSGCLVSVLDKRVVGAVLHLPKTLAPTWAFTFTGAPAAVPSILDLDLSFGTVPFGGGSELLVEPHLTETFGNVRHYNRRIDDTVRYMGVPCAVVFDFEPEVGLYGGLVRVEGDTAAYTLRQNLKTRFGTGKWDNDLKAWYWRGEHRIYVSTHPPDSTYELLRIIDMDRARKAGLVDAFPGDPERVDPAGGRRLPKVLQNAPGTGERPRSASEPAPESTPPTPAVPPPADPPKP